MSLGTYGLMVWLAFFCAYFVLEADLRRRKLPGDPLNIILFLVMAGLAGSKLYHVMESPAEFFADPVGLFFSRNGFAWFGGFLGGLAVLFWLARHYRIPSLTFLDASSPAAALGYAIGRLGCLISGDGDYGIATSLPWGMKFPPLEPGCRVQHFVCVVHGALDPSIGTHVGAPTTAIVPVHPTPVYEAVVGLLIAYYLWRRGAQQWREGFQPGSILAQYLVLTGIARFLVEFIRINPRSAFGVLTNAQVVSLLSILAGAALMMVLRSRSGKPQPVANRTTR